MKRVLIMTLSGIIGSASAATIATKADGTSNYFGRTAGIAIDFNAASDLTYATSDLVSGQQYNVDSITLFTENSTDNIFYYLAAYSNMSGGDTFSGFLGVSTNAINLFATGNEAVTWNFTGLTVTPNEVVGGDDVIYFLLQESANAITTIFSNADDDPRPPLTYIEGGTRFARIDGGPGGGGYAQALNAVIHGNASQGAYQARPLEFSASLSLIPEPSTALLGGLGFLVLFRRCRS